MISIRHRSNSGRLDACWEFDSERRVVDLVIQQGNTTITATVPVCSPDRPRHGAYPITRLDACTWHVIPAMFVLEPTGKHFIPHDVSIADGLDMQHVALTDAPGDVDVEIAEL